MRQRRRTTFCSIAAFYARRAGTRARSAQVEQRKLPLYSVVEQVLGESELGEGLANKLTTIPKTAAPLPCFAVGTQCSLAKSVNRS